MIWASHPWQQKNYADVVSEMPELLKTIQSDLLATAEQRIQNMMHHVSTLDELQSGLASQKAGFYRMPYSETLKPEFDELISTYKISRRCLDDRDPTFVFVAKSY